MVSRITQERDATPRDATDRRRGLAGSLDRHEPTGITVRGRLD